MTIRCTHSEKGVNTMSNLFFGNKNTELSDDDFTDEELAIIYGTGVRGPISCEEDREEKALEEIGAY